MIDCLSKETRTVSELRDPLGISMPAAMQHLAVLEKAGLVRSEKRGRVRTCSLNSQALAEAEQWIAGRRQLLSDRLDALGDFLSGETSGDQDQ